MHIVVKSIVGLVVAGGSAGLGIGGYYLMKPKTLMEKFKKEGLEILNYKTGDKQAWNAKLDKYKTSEESSNRFEGLNGTSDGDLQNLKKKCGEYLEQSPAEIGKTKDLEAKVKKWCTKDKPQ